MTIEPKAELYGLSSLHIEVIVNETKFTAVIPYEEDHFNSMFDLMIERTKKEIKRILDENNK